MAAAGRDPYEVLGIAHGATEAAIHAAYRAAVRRTHPDAGGTRGEFEAVQEAYETLRDPTRRRRFEAAAAHRAASPPPDAARQSMDDLLAESHRLEDEARRLAGMRPRYSPGSAEADEVTDSLGAVLHDAGEQLTQSASRGAEAVRRFLDRLR